MPNSKAALLNHVHERILSSALQGGVDLHSDDAVETLLADPERMRRMLQTIGHVENSDVMSPNELLMRLRCAYASAAASHNDMEVRLLICCCWFCQLRVCYRCTRYLGVTTHHLKMPCDAGVAFVLLGGGRRS